MPGVGLLLRPIQQQTESHSREVWSRALVRSVARKVTGWDDGEGFEMGRGKKFFLARRMERKKAGEKGTNTAAQMLRIFQRHRDHEDCARKNVRSLSRLDGKVGGGASVVFCGAE